MQEMDPQITDPRLNKTVLNGLTANKRYRIHMWGKTENGRGEVSFIEVTTAKTSGMSKAFYCRVFRFLRVPKKKKKKKRLMHSRDHLLKHSTSQLYNDF